MRPALNTAEFNIREITKQMLLLEEHLSDDEKYCKDCICKHLLLIEGYSEEALSLDPYSKWATECRKMAINSREWLMQFLDQRPKEEIAQIIRKIRKTLVKKTCDPRSKH